MTDVAGRPATHAGLAVVLWARKVPEPGVLLATGVAGILPYAAT